MVGYERVVILGRSYMVCAECRRALLKGYNPLYLVPQPGTPAPDPKTKQALCGPCYKSQYKRIQPDDEVPKLDDGYFGEVTDPIPFGARTYLDETDEFSVWEAAVAASRASGGGETVLQAYTRLSGSIPPDVEMTAPPEQPKQSKKSGRTSKAR